MTSLDEIKGLLTSIDTRLDGIDTRLDGIDTRLDGMDKRFDGMDTRLDGMDKRFDRIEATTRLLSDNVIGLSKDLELQRIANDQLARDVVGIGRNIATQMQAFELKLESFDARLRIMLAQNAQARTQDLERMMRFEERLKNL